MRAKSLLLLIIALGCGTVASVGISQVMMDQKGGSTEPATVEIYVAMKDVDVNQKLTPELFKLEKWPQNRVPDGAIFKLEEVKDRYVRQRMYPGEPILAGKLNDSIVGVDTEIPRGFRVFDLSVNERNGGSGYIKPGARVDVLGTFKVNNITESRTVMRNVRIFGINGVTVRDTDPSTTNRATTFQLLVHESQMDALNLATAMGELRCTLRGTVENQNTEEGTDTGEAFISWVRGSDTRVASVVNSTGSAGADIFGGPTPMPLEPPTEEKKKQLLIITPNGVTKYQWTRDDELPQKVDALAEQNSAGVPVSAASLLQGLGGYTPVYPGGDGATSENTPDQSGNANGAKENENQSVPQVPNGSSASSAKSGSAKTPPRPPLTGL
ncbi:MAG: Flp pilus assembly protein CpaB [Pirellulaceae bacterium]|nr:Flp pilus assembly protein CpaB [Pirellulaceae bacterium]